ncbi:uncharacterized protein LOC119733630 [Patiria miniata]|uniref:Uncharacterized protein n=1 Tax=Patiria miniata TaxID=46514 RepID=A0A914AGW8_PATMI|nr:uncharacterized protein LOC119733630 [Patiria miniata]
MMSNSILILALLFVLFYLAAVPTMEYLVTCGMSRKVVKAADNSELEARIREVFEIPEKNKITLQVYSQKWGEYIDTRAQDVESSAKINVINYESEFPLIIPSSSESNFDTMSIPSFSSVSQILSDSGSDMLVSDCVSSPDQDNCSVPVPNMSESLVTVGAQNWPSPFKLHWQCFPPDLKMALAEKKQLDIRQQKKLVQAVFDEMRRVTWTPHPWQYDEAARAITETYPHLADKTPLCKPHDIWKGRLSDKFRNERKRKRTQDQLSSPETVAPKRQRSSTQSSTLQLPEGEDEVSMERHISALCEEHKKRQGDENKIDKLMDLTFPVRRQAILKKALVVDIKAQYPALFTPKQIFLELGRMIPSLESLNADICIKKMSPYVSAIMNYPFYKKADESFLRLIQTKIFSSEADTEKEYLKTAGAILMLPSFFVGENRTHLITDQKDESAVHVQPHLQYSGQQKDLLSMEDSYAVYAEQQELFEVTGLIDGLLTLLATYFIFDMAYPKGIRNTLTFLQLNVLKMTQGAKPPKPVSRVINLLRKGDE